MMPLIRDDILNGSGLLVLNLSRGLVVFIIHHDSHIVENQAQLGLVCEHTLRVNGHSNGQESPISFLALTMSHRIIFYDT